MDQFQDHNPTTSLEEAEEYSKFECVVCRSSFGTSELTTLACGHNCCYTCLARLFKISIIDNQPAMCCPGPSPLSIQDYEEYLPQELLQAYDDKQEEMHDVFGSYCHVPTCGAYIPSRNCIMQVGICMACNATTCIECEGNTHHGPCPSSEADWRLRTLARQHGWQSCPQCGVLVEKLGGCDSVQCFCGFIFCYACGKLEEVCVCHGEDDEPLHGHQDDLGLF